MIPLDQFAQVALKRIRIMAVMLLIVVPIIYLAVAQMVEVVPHEGGDINLMFYLLIIVALIEPGLFPIIERIQISNFRKAVNAKMQPAQFSFTIGLTKLAMIEAIYIFGLVFYFLSGDLSNYLLFYIPGIFWTLRYWPNESRLKILLEKLEAA